MRQFPRSLTVLFCRNSSTSIRTSKILSQHFKISELYHIVYDFNKHSENILNFIEIFNAERLSKFF